MKVKICGITNLDDAMAAAEAGADYLGFIFHSPSKRAINEVQARFIAGRFREREVRPVLVGVFVDETPSRIAQLLKSCRLDLAQLSGNEPASMIRDRQSPIWGRCYKALKPRAWADAESNAGRYLAEPRPGARPALLLDAYHPTLAGGTGRQVDWALAARLSAAIPGLMLAGGLQPDNVGRAVTYVRPYGVDVASGVEKEPGKKDHAKMATFIRTAKSAATGGTRRKENGRN